MTQHLKQVLATTPPAAITSTWRRTRSAANAKQSFVLATGEAILDRYVLTLNVAGFV